MPPSPIGTFLFEKKLKQPTAPNVPQARPVVAAADRVRRVLDHGEAVSLREREHLVDRAREAAVVQRADRLRPRRDRRLEVGRVEVELAVADDVAEHRLGAGLPDGVRRGDERQRRCDHLGAMADAEGDERQLESGRAVRDRDRMSAADRVGELRLELCDPRTGAPPARPHRLGRRSDQLLVADDVGERDDPAGRAHST